MARILVVSDIHSNQSALEAVLEDAERHGPYNVKLCPGDLVGYGPNPNEVIDMIQREGFIIVLGNHDRTVRDGDTTGFNIDAARASRYNTSILTSESRAFLDGLSNVPYIDPQGRFAMVHGSFNGVAKKENPWDKLYEDIYVFNKEDVPRVPDSNQGEEIILGILGHTHIPTYAHFFITQEGLDSGKEVDIKFHQLVASEYKDFGSVMVNLDFGATPLPKAIFNPGSVGQPRNGSNKAAYGIIDLDGRNIKLEFRSVPYNITETQRRMKEVGLNPEIGGFSDKLIKRLEYGR